MILILNINIHSQIFIEPYVPRTVLSSRGVGRNKIDGDITFLSWR